MTIITIPRSREDMVSRLTGIQRLLTATQWEKAAILAAFVELSEHGGDRKSIKMQKHLDRMSTEEFASLGVAGLRHKNTVRRYVRRWIATTRPIPKPGEQVDLDGLPEWETEVVEAQQPEPRKQVQEESSPEQERVDEAWQNLHDHLVKEEEAAAVGVPFTDEDNAETERLMRLVGKEKEAQDLAANSGRAKGLELFTLAKILVDDMHRWGHTDRIAALRDYASALLEAQEAQSLTPEMFHD